MKAARKKRNLWILLIAFVIALAAQVGLLELLRLQTVSAPMPPIPSPKRQLHATLRPIQKRPKPPETKPEEIDGTIVSLPEPEIKKKPDDTKHLAKFDVDVQKEQKSRHRDRRSKQRRQGEERVRKPSPIQSPDSPSKQETKLDREPKERELPKARPDMRPTDRGEKATPKDLARGEKPNLLLPAADEQSAITNLQTLSAQFDSDDALLDIEKEGDTTLLKAKSFRFFDFFDRVKERVRQQWQPGDAYRQRDPTGKVYGVKDRLTILRVTLDESGRVLKVVTHKKSGVDFLDKEARRAFRAAAPFPNPPSGLLDDTKQITFGIGFLFEIGSSRPRFFWKRM